jgi:hypothetical protein
MRSVNIWDITASYCVADQFFRCWTNIMASFHVAGQFFRCWTDTDATGNVIAGKNDLKESTGFWAYKMENNVTKDLAKFSLANAIYAALVEAHACEQSALACQILSI